MVLILISDEVKQFRCESYLDIETPVNVLKLEEFLVQSHYSELETRFLLDGFRQGFSIRYEGPQNHESTSKNLPFTVGSPVQLWNKIMKEVGLNRVGGPFASIPFTSFMQSPVCLVPKDGDQVRLIFHLSYEFLDGLGSLNGCTPDEICSVNYRDLDFAVRTCLPFLTSGFHLVKSDL